MLKKLLAMAAASVMMLSCFGAAAQAEYGYTWGATVTSETASTKTDSWPNKWDSDTSDSKKRSFMTGVDESTELASSYWRLFDGTESSGSFLRLNSSSSYGSALIVGMNEVYRFNGHDLAGYNFYSTSKTLAPRLEILDTNSKSGAGLTTQTSKNIATTLTYKFNVKCEYSFVDMYFYIGTRFNGNDTNKDIQAIKIGADEKLYITNRYLLTDAVEVAELTKGKEHEIGLVVKLIPTDTENSYDYELSVYLDGSHKHTVAGYNKVQTSKPGFYGMEITPVLWEVTDFDYTKDSMNGNTFAYTAKNSLTPTSSSYDGVLLSEKVKAKYTIIDTDTTISDFTVYAGNKYAENAQSLSHADSDFYISSNVRNNTNYVTVAAQTASNDSATSAKAILATYDSTGKLANVVSSPAMTLIKGGIAETDIELTNEGALTKKLFIFDSLGNLKPLTADIELD